MIRPSPRIHPSTETKTSVIGDPEQINLHPVLTPRGLYRLSNLFLYRTVSSFLGSQVMWYGTQCQLTGSNWTVFAYRKRSSRVFQVWFVSGAVRGDLHRGNKLPDPVNLHNYKTTLRSLEITPQSCEGLKDSSHLMYWSITFEKCQKRLQKTRRPATKVKRYFQTTPTVIK